MSQFIVADLETTGLSAARNEIIEFGAILSAPDGTVLDEYQVLVCPEGPVSKTITRLTGISQEMVETDGVALHKGFLGFVKFAGRLPIYFHNASFDRQFLGAAQEKTGLQIKGEIRDTLRMARTCWPHLDNHKLDTLAAHVGREPGGHRALSDARVTHAVLVQMMREGAC